MEHEKSIGSIIKWKDITIQVQEEENIHRPCRKCLFYEKTNLQCEDKPEWFGPCVKDDRNDNKSVCFVELK